MPIAWLRRVVLAAMLAPALAGAAGADVIPPTGAYLTGLGGSNFSFVIDGTSNTILLSEQTRLSFCVDNAQGSAPLFDIADGTSNTIQFGENLYATFLVGTSLARQPIANIQDGTSNTIFIGESLADERCFAGETRVTDIGQPIVDGTSNTIQFGEESAFDVCFRSVRVGGVADGTSNTIQFGEVTTAPLCYSGVRVLPQPAVAAAPEPAALALFGLGLAALAAGGNQARRRLRAGPVSSSA